MTKLSYNGYTFYTWNGNVENSRDSFLLYIHGGSFIDKPLNIQLNFVKKVAKKFYFLQKMVLFFILSIQRGK